MKRRQHSINYILCMLCMSLFLIHCTESVLFGYYYNTSSTFHDGKCKNCLPCPNCVSGSQPGIPCGKVNKRLSLSDLNCVHCLKGFYKSDNTWMPCKRCSVCSSNEIEIMSCDPSHDRRCSCKAGYYRISMVTGKCKAMHPDFDGWYYEQGCEVCPRRRCVECPAGTESVTPCGKVEDLNKVNVTCRACPDGTHKRDVSWNRCTKFNDFTYAQSPEKSRDVMEFSYFICIGFVVVFLMLVMVLAYLVCRKKRANKSSFGTDREKLRIDNNIKSGQEFDHWGGIRKSTKGGFEKPKRYWDIEDPVSPVFNSEEPAQYYWILDVPKKIMNQVKMHLAVCEKDISGMSKIHGFESEGVEEIGSVVTQSIQRELEARDLKGIDVALTEIRNEEMPVSAFQSKIMEIQSILDFSSSPLLKSEELTNRYSKTAMEFANTLSGQVKHKAKVDFKLQTDALEHQKWEVTDSTLLISTVLKKKGNRFWTSTEHSKMIECFTSVFYEEFGVKNVDVKHLQSMVLVKDKYRFTFTFSFTNDALTDPVNTLISEYKHKRMFNLFPNGNDSVA